MTRIYRVEFEAGPFVGSAEDLITRLHKVSRAPCPTNMQWVKETASRLCLQSGIVVRTENFDAFVADLIQHDYVHILDKDTGVRDNSSGEQTD